MQSEYERALASPTMITYYALPRSAILPSTPFELAFFYAYDRERPTEWGSFLLWGKGFLKAKDVDGVKTFALPFWYDQRPPGRLDGAVLTQRQPLHKNAVGRICRECGNRLPLNNHYWHIDKTHEGGYKHVCKRCVNRAKKRRGLLLQIKTPA